MGNVWFRKRKRTEEELQINPLVVEEEHHDVHKGVRLKLRMKSGQLQELMAKVSEREGKSSELGGLIFQECLKGRLRARLVAASYGKGSDSELSAFKYAKGWGLSPIQEHSDHDHYM